MGPPRQEGEDGALSGQRSVYRRADARRARETRPWTGDGDVSAALDGAVSHSKSPTAFATCQRWKVT